MAISDALELERHRRDPRRLGDAAAREPYDVDDRSTARNSPGVTNRTPS